MKISKVTGQYWLRSHPTLGGGRNLKIKDWRSHEKSKNPRKSEWWRPFLNGKKQKKNDQVKVKTKWEYPTNINSIIINAKERLYKNHDITNKTTWYYSCWKNKC
jgi:hypothetical protein